MKLINRPDATQQIVAGEPQLRVLYLVFILSGCRDSRGHQLNRSMLADADMELVSGLKVCTSFAFSSCCSVAVV
jgi:hypothetical protein